MPQFSTYTPPAAEEGDQWSARDAGGRGAQIIVKVLKHQTGVITENSPDGTDCVRVDVVDLSDPTGQYVFRNVPIFTGAIVDGLKQYAGTGDVLVLDMELRQARSGRKYPTIKPASDFSRAEAFYASKGDPFAAQFSTVPATGGPGQGSTLPPF